MGHRPEPRDYAARPVVLGTPTPSKVCQSILNRLVRSGLQGWRGCEVTLDGRLWGADLSSVLSCGMVVSGSRSRANDLPKLTPPAKLAGTPISGDETVAKMGHLSFVVVSDLGHTPFTGDSFQ